MLILVVFSVNNYKFYLKGRKTYFYFYFFKTGEAIHILRNYKVFPYICILICDI
jgi:hypothetical protein